MSLRAPFPWFGGKSRVAHLVWERFGDVPNYVEPFAGSLAVLLGRPTDARTETVNDRDAYLSNFWRAVQSDAPTVARWADWPVSEADLHARHRWLVDQGEFRERMLSDPDFYDAKIAGWWVWGISQWIGSGWCSRPEWTGRSAFGSARGIHTDRYAQRPSATPNGVHVKRPRLGAGGRGITRQLPDLGGDSGATGKGIHASGKRPHLWRGGNGVHAKLPRVGERPWGLQVTPVEEWMLALQARLRRVRVCCGDWSRILGPSPTTKIGVTGVFLDPPYGDEGRVPQLYAHDDLSLASDVRRWAHTHGDDPLLRIALCGYEGEHDELESAGWSVVAWKAPGGYAVRVDGRGRENAARERIWFSPHCLRPGQARLFA